MAGETDFNLSDDVDDDALNDGGNGGDGAHHAGDEGGAQGDPEDRGDVVTDDGEGGEGGASTEGTIDPAFLASLAGDKAPQTVPYARLAEVAAENRRLMGVIEGLATGRIAQPSATAAAEPEKTEPVFDLKAKLREKNAALLEGDEDKALEIDMEVEEYRNTTLRAQVRQETMADLATAKLKTDADGVVADAFGKYTFLNDQSADHNPEALEEVMVFRNHFLAKGDTLPVALQKAIDKVAKGYASEPTTTETDPGKTADPKAAAILRNAKAASQQPAELGKAGTANREAIDTSKLDLETMSDDDYDALPASVKARLRGDVAS